MPRGERLQFPERAAPLARAWLPPPSSRKPPLRRKDIPFFILVDEHPVGQRRVFQRADVGAVLVQLHEILPVLVQKRKMSGDNDFFRANAARRRHRRHSLQFAHLGLLANAQPADNGCKEVQRPELRLFPKADRAVHSERQRQAADKRGGMPELVQRAQLGFSLARPARE